MPLQRLSRNYVKAWLRLFILALVPLFLMATAATLYLATTIPRTVRETSRDLVEANQRIVANMVLTHRDLARRLAVESEGLLPHQVAKRLADQVDGRQLVEGMAWIPDQGQPVLTAGVEPFWVAMAATLASGSEALHLFAVPESDNSYLLIREWGERSQLLTLLRLDQLASQLASPEHPERWYALVDRSGFELAFHDATARLAGMAEIVSVSTESALAPGWRFIGYTSTRPTLKLATMQLWWAVGFALVSLVAGIALVIPGARKLLLPIKRLGEVARILPVQAQVAASQLAQHESAVAVVNQLEDRLHFLEEQHKHFFAESEVPFCIIAWPGTVIEMNRAMCNLLGYPPEYFNDHRISETLHPTERFRVSEAYPELQSVNKTVHWTWHHISGTGEELWLNWSTTSDVERRLLYAICRDVTADRWQERNRTLHAAVQQLWLVAKSGDGLQALLDEMMHRLAPLFPHASFAVWEEPDNGRWFLRAGNAEVDPEGSGLSFEIAGELVRFGLLVIESEIVLVAEEESFFESMAEMISTALNLEREAIRLRIQNGVNRLLVEAESIEDLLVQLLPLIGQPVGGVAAQFWAPAEGEQVRVMATWRAPEAQVGSETFDLHRWMVLQTLSDGRPRWIADGTSLPNRPDEVMPVGRVTFAVRVGLRIVGCIDLLVPVLRTPDAGFLTLMESLGAQIGLYLERRTSEEERRRQALLAAGRGDIMDMVATGAPLESVLDRLLGLVETLLPEVWTLAVYYDAAPDRPLLLLGPSCPPEKMEVFHDLVRIPRTPELMLRLGRFYMNTPGEILSTLRRFGPHLIEMGVQSCWVWPISLTPSSGTLILGYYSSTETGLLRYEPLLNEVSRLAQMAVERWWLGEALNRRVDLLLEHMQEGLIAVDGEIRVVQTNPAARKILHMATPFLPGRNGAEDLPEPLTEAFRQALLPEAQPFPVTMKIDGAPVYAYLSPVRSEEGALLGAIAILEDSALRQRFQQLQTALVANVSHDLKAPLAALGALVETVADQQLPPDLQQQYLGSMRDEIARLRRLTNDLLLLARLDAGLLTLQPEALAMRDLLQGLAEAWAPRCQARNQRLIVTGDPITGWADYDRLIQVLTNLLDNAIKFTPPGGEIQLGVEAAGEDRMRVFVRDTGQGIAAEHLERLGARFYMVDVARERGSVTGTGLGLSIVRSLAHLMGGQLQIESIVGEGTTVWLELPRPPASA